MSRQRFRISKTKFLEWYIHGADQDIKERFIKELRKTHNFRTSTKALFEELDSLPAFLFEEQLTKEEKEEMEDIPISDIFLEKYIEN